MAVFRVERTGDYTVMSNFHLKDKRLSLKAKGLLSQMLSLPDDWDYDLFIDLEHSTNLRTTAKELAVPERRFVRFLLEKRFVYRTASGNVLP